LNVSFTPKAVSFFGHLVIHLYNKWKHMAQKAKAEAEKARHSSR
jgi:hypothetical protein